jgi:hypothetical protein
VNPVTDAFAADLPLYGVFRDAAGEEYALAVARESHFVSAGIAFSILMRNPDMRRIVVALPMRSEATTAAAGLFDVLYDDGQQWVVCLRDEQDVLLLSDLGFAVGRLTDRLSTSDVRLAPMAFASSFVSHAWVAAALEGINSNELASLVSQITGEEPAPAAGTLRTVTTRSTTAGATTGHALAFGYEYLRALGMTPTWQGWANNVYANSNIVADQIGGVLSNEIVVVVAHIDNSPSSGRAPGADDNASGSVAVLTAASVLSQCRFDRTVRYLLVTGEEQGLFGSAAYAAAARAAGAKIVGVLNLDMIAWNSTGSPTANLYTRSINNTGYPGDRIIADTFINVVATYGLSDNITPVIIPDTSIWFSDHSKFWNQGYSAILAIEAYGSDFNPYYHTSNDTLSRFNMPYFTAFVRAAVGTVAHLAGPAEASGADCIRVVSGDWTPGSTLGASLFHARHDPLAAEGQDGYDWAWEDNPANPYPLWLQLSSASAGTLLATDSRNTNSESFFRGMLRFAAPAGVVTTCTSHLRFSFLSSPLPERYYSLRVTLDPQFTVDQSAFLCVTNLRDLVALGGFLELPPLVGLTNGAVYGTFDLATRFVNSSASTCVLGAPVVSRTGVELPVSAQVGAHIFDAIDRRHTLATTEFWTETASFTNHVQPTSENFETGWTVILHPLQGLPAPTTFYSLRRHWLNP